MSRAAVRRLAVTALGAVVVASSTACGGDDAPRVPESPGGGTTPPAGVARLGWSQILTPSAAIQNYRFVLFIDGARTLLPDASCSGVATLNFVCSAQLPRLSPGPRTLELSAVDQVTGLEGPRSIPLIVDVDSTGRPVPRASVDSAPELTLRVTNDESLAAGGAAHQSQYDLAAEIHLPPVACAIGDPSTCFTVTVIAANIGPPRRLLQLPDSRLLVLLEDGAVTMLPSSTTERPDLGRAEAGRTIELADVALDPDFGANRFLYFAAVATDAYGRRTVSVVRVRELADRMGEAATIVADLPAAPTGRPAISVGPDRRIYLAMASAQNVADRQLYDGQVLRFTRDGAAAGQPRSVSPIVAQGIGQPALLTWDARTRLLLASRDSWSAPLTVVPVESRADAWPADVIRVRGTESDDFRAGLDNVAVVPRIASSVGDARVWLLGASAEVLYIATLTSGNAPEIASRHPVPLGSFMPRTFTMADNGDLMVAARPRKYDGRTSLLRVRAR